MEERRKERVSFGGTVWVNREPFGPQGIQRMPAKDATDTGPIATSKFKIFWGSMPLQNALGVPIHRSLHPLGVPGRYVLDQSLTNNR